MAATTTDASAFSTAWVPILLESAVSINHPRPEPVHIGRLLLATRDPHLLPDPSAVEEALAAHGFLGARLPGRTNAFLAGDRFLRLLTFAGCSVQVELSPTGDGPFCHVLITGPFESPRFLSGRGTRPPRCPACRNPLKKWQQTLAAWESGETANIPCPSCGETNPPWAYDWKEKAGFGRLFVQIEEVFPGEAVPTPELMKLVERVTHSEWRHFYIQN